MRGNPINLSFYLRNFKKSGLEVILLAGLSLLAACGDSPTSTPVPVAPTTLSTTPAAPGQGNRLTPGQPPANLPQTVTGTVENYDASAKVLTVKSADGKSQQFSIANALVSKSEKLSSDEFSKQAAANGLVLVAGDKNSDGSYNARQLTLLDPASFGGPAGGQPPGGAGATGAPPGANEAGPGLNANNPIILGGTLSGNKFSGQSFTGETVTAMVSSSTILNKQIASSASDLKTGQNLTITFATAAGSGPIMAFVVAINQVK
jgi:hypothetical protein